MNTITVRRMRPADTPTVVRLITTVSNLDGWPITRPVSRHKAAGWFLRRTAVSRHVAVLRSRIVGFGITYDIAADDPSLTGWAAATGVDHQQMIGLGALLVHPAGRRLGAGAALVAARLDEAATTGRVPVAATVHPPDQFGGVYARLGGRLVGQDVCDGRPLWLWAWPDPTTTTRSASAADVAPTV